MEEKKVERRNDVGLKLVYVILTAMITFLLSIIFFETYRKAEASQVKSNALEVRVATVEESLKGISKGVSDLNWKMDKLICWKD